jgi:hypothetical protein
MAWIAAELHIVTRSVSEEIQPSAPHVLANASGYDEIASVNELKSATFDLQALVNQIDRLKCGS